MSDGIVDAITYPIISPRLMNMPSNIHTPGPLAAVRASSPMKKSKSSVPLFADKLPPPAPPVRNVGLLATAGLPEPEPPPPAGPPLVAIAVGKTKDGESLPANPTVVLAI